MHAFRTVPVVAVRRPAGEAEFHLLDVPGVSFMEENGRVFALETVLWGAALVMAANPRLPARAVAASKL